MILFDGEAGRDERGVRFLEMCLSWVGLGVLNDDLGMVSETGFQRAVEYEMNFRKTRRCGVDRQ
jgi:hypothetical protein